MSAPSAEVRRPAVGQDLSQTWNGKPGFGRLEDKGHPSMPQTNQEKQAVLRAKRQREGLRRREYWATETEHEQIAKLLTKLEKKRLNGRRNA